MASLPATITTLTSDSPDISFHHRYLFEKKKCDMTLIYNVEKFIEKNNEYVNSQQNQINIPYNKLIPTECYHYYTTTELNKNIDSIFNKKNNVNK